MNEIERLASLYETHIIVGILAFALAYVFGFIHGDTRKRRS